MRLMLYVSRFFCSLVVLLSTAGGTTCAWAVEESVVALAPPVDWLGEVVRVVGFLLVLIVLGVLAVRFGRKYTPQLGGGGPIRIEDGRNFAPGVGVRLIRVGSRAWLLGVSKDRVSLLAEMRPEDWQPVKETLP